MYEVELANETVVCANTFSETTTADEMSEQRHGQPAANHRRQRSRLQLSKRLLFSLIPILLLLTIGELTVRVAGLDAPQLMTNPMAEEMAGLFVRDPDLFWSLKPELDIEFKGAKVQTNSLGLRSPKMHPKRPNEIRILSLGESSTFGYGVSNDQTYTSLLPKLLQDHAPTRVITAFNAGVPAWSSFQSLKFLELRGAALKPDLVIFYHELNDYIPTSLRDSSNTEIGVMKTDPELYASRQHSLLRQLVNVSALMRMLESRVAYWRIKAFSAGAGAS